MNSEPTLILPAFSFEAFSSRKNLDYKTVSYFSADVNYTKVHFIGGGSRVFSYTIKRFEEILANNPNFVRIHKAYLVNKNCIVEIGDSELFMCCGKRLPIARRRRYLL